jgi:putative ATP-binding cassette transporter
LLGSSGRSLALALIASVASGFGGTLLVALINEALSADTAALSTLGWKFASLSLLVLGLRWASETQFVSLSQNTLAQLRVLLSQRIAAAPYRQIEGQGAPRFLAILTEDIAAVAQFFTTLPDLVMHAAVVLGCLAYLGILSWQVLLFALAMVVVGSLVYHRAHERALQHLRRARTLEDELFQHFRALLEGAKELKLHHARRNAFLSELLNRCVERVREQRVRGLRISVASTSFGSFLFFVLIGTVLFGLGRWLGADGRVASGYALMFLYMILPLEAVLGAIPSVQRTRVALERIQSLTSELPKDVIERPSEAVAFQQLRLREVTHRYQRDNQDGVFTVGPIDLELRAGELVFLAGGNGSGKTTLAKLLVGLYQPDAGEVLLNGVAVTDATREAYRQHFSAVFSDFFLFDRLLGVSGSLGGGRDEIDERARVLLRELGLEHKLTISAGELSTIELSQGQRKRLALLVAYLEERPVYLFDEWAADQDPTYKDVFYRKLLPELKARGKAVLVISHDDRYFHLADRLLKLDSGKLVPAHEAQNGQPPRQPLPILAEPAPRTAAAIRPANRKSEPFHEALESSEPHDIGGNHELGQ